MLTLVKKKKREIILHGVEPTFCSSGVADTPLEGEERVRDGVSGGGLEGRTFLTVTRLSSTRAALLI